MEIDEILQRLEILEYQAAALRKGLDEARSRLTIVCVACSIKEQIKNIVVIQTLWYDPPRGCTEGACWNYGELNYICPHCHYRNRFLFNNYTTPYEHRNKFEYDPEQQFKRYYKHLFKDVEEIEDTKLVSSFYNNYYVDENREKFGLVEKWVEKTI